MVCVDPTECLTGSRTARFSNPYYAERYTAPAPNSSMWKTGKISRQKSQNNSDKRKRVQRFRQTFFSLIFLTYQTHFTHQYPFPLGFSFTSHDPWNPSSTVPDSFSSASSSQLYCSSCFSAGSPLMPRPDSPFRRKPGLNRWEWTEAHCCRRFSPLARRSKGWGRKRIPRKRLGRRASEFVGSFVTTSIFTVPFWLCFCFPFPFSFFFDLFCCEENGGKENSNEGQGWRAMLF